MLVGNVMVHKNELRVDPESYLTPPILGAGRNFKSINQSINQSKFNLVKSLRGLEGCSQYPSHRLMYKTHD